MLVRAGILWVCFIGVAEAGYDDKLPFPREFVHKVEFWKAIYTKYTTRQGVIHDAQDLSIIYEAVELPRNGDTSEVEYIKGQVREHLFNIVRKRGENLTTEERRLLAKFPANTTRSRLLQATENVRFQLGQTDRFREGVIRSGAYMKHIEKILREEDMPDFIKYLPHVESSFQEFAMSKFGAAGLWQLMPATGKLYLKVEYTVDERLDPITATRAAARHLKRDHQRLGAWPLALTAYNHGTNGILRAVQTLGTNDIAEIAFRYESPSFGFASRNFYGQFLAAVEVASNYKKYFGDIPLRDPIVFENVVVARSIYLDEFLQGYRVTNEDFRKLNPSLRPPVLMNRRPLPKGTTLRVPPNSKRSPVLVAAADKKVIKAAPTPAAKKAEAEILAPLPKVALKRVPEVKPSVSRYAIKDFAEGKGWIQLEMNETLTQVAEWLNQSPDEIRQWNGIDSQGQARAGQKLIIKLSAVQISDFETSREDYHRKIREDFFSQYEVVKTTDYQVKRGENLWSLCYQKFDIPPWLLEEYNPKVKIHSLSGGTKLKIPVLREKESTLVSSSQ